MFDVVQSRKCTEHNESPSSKWNKPETKETAQFAVAIPDLAVSAPVIYFQEPNVFVMAHS